MTTTTTPSPAPGGDVPPARTSSRIVAILAIIVGSVIVVGAIGGAILSTIGSLGTRMHALTADAAGVSELELDTSTASVVVLFTDTRDARLQVTGGRGAGGWSLERDGDALHVHSPHGWQPWRWFGGSEEVVLELPRQLRGLDASFTVAAGSLETDADFGDVDVELGAGEVTLTGSADDVSARVSVGEMTLDLADVRTADLQASAGQIDARLHGAPPREVTIDVSAGTVDLTVPDATYDVTSRVSVGDLANDLDTSSRSSNRISVQVEAGDVTLRSER